MYHSCTRSIVVAILSVVLCACHGALTPESAEVSADGETTLPDAGSASSPDASGTSSPNGDHREPDAAEPSVDLGQTIPDQGAGTADAGESDPGPDPEYCTHPNENRHAQMVDLGEEGLQPGEDLSPWLEDYWKEGWEVRVPGGSYTLSDPRSFSMDASEHSWLVGDGEVIVDHGEEHVEFNFESNGDAHVRVQNFTLRGKDVGDDSKVRVFARGEDGLVEVINFNRPDGTMDGYEGTGFFVPRQHAGVSRFINCHIEGFTDNGIYASSPGGSDGANGHIEVFGGLYKNNNVAGVRLGGDGGMIIGATVVNDASGGSSSGGPGVQRGIRVREEGENTLIEDCDITHLDEAGVAEPIEVRDAKFEDPDGDEEVIVRNVRIRNETDNPAINTDDPDYPVSGMGIHLTGEGSYQIDGEGPFENVVEGADADMPVTVKRWACTGRFGDFSE